MDIRHTIANQLYRTLDHNFFKNKNVIDVGTRNGVNAFMMKKIGAKSITAIDPNNSEFPKKTQNIKFIKNTLQDYLQECNKQFDTVTVFLWNIPFLEYDSFMYSVKKVLVPNGTLIIGIHDNIYYKDWRSPLCVATRLFEHGFKISQINKNDGINRYIIYAQYKN